MAGDELQHWGLVLRRALTIFKFDLHVSLMPYRALKVVGGWGEWHRACVCLCVSLVLLGGFEGACLAWSFLGGPS